MLQTSKNTKSTGCVGEPSLEISSWREGNSLFLALRGDVDLRTVRDLRKAIAEGLKDNTCNEIVADMARVLFVDSSGYGAFLGAMQALRLRGGGRVHLASCQPAVARMLAIIRLHNVFVIHDSLEQARESLHRVHSG